MNPAGVPERYELLHFIGRGAMGSVYCATDTRLHRKVALKLLRVPTDTDDGSERAASIARMLREARAAAALEHPNIVAIYDVGEVTLDDKPSCFIAMELVEGTPLRDYIGQLDVPFATRVAWLSDIARALAFAHGRGIIHRDVKPENVMIREDGLVKVLDFGLARRAAEVVSPPDDDAYPNLTMEGELLGTPGYMAPEQMLRAVLDARADQFAWGVVAYELLVGLSPWGGHDSSIQVMAHVLQHEATPMLTLDPTLSPGLAAIVHRAIARDRADRYESMDAVLDALDEAFPASSQSRRAAPPARITKTVAARKTELPHRRPRIVEMSALAVGVGAIAATALTGREPGPAPTMPDPRECRSNAECAAAGGETAICRAATGRCAVLGSEDCHVVAEPGDIRNDRTVWVGAMFPLVGQDAQSFGKREFQAVDLARSEFASMLRGTQASPDAVAAPPLGIVACDDSVDAARAARHLVDDIGVPAVIGFRKSSEVIDLATSTFIPRGVLTVAALNTSPIITSLPRLPGQPRMVFRTTYSSGETARPIGLLLSDVIEPELRARPAVLRRGDDLRVALMREDGAAGLGFADALFGALRFNGRSALENGSAYQEIAYPFDLGDGGEPDLDAVADKLVAFAPHVVIHFGADADFVHILERVERDWRSPSFRPRYVKPTTLSPVVLEFIGANAELRRRFFSLTSASRTAANARFVARYRSAYADPVTRTFSPNSSYDAFYLVAYATYALRDEPVTGTALARAVARLLPPGRAVDVGPSGIFDALNSLSSGAHIDLNGATGALDFDLDTGDAPVDLAILCVKANAGGDAEETVESGLVYDATAGVFRGTMRCP
jgi:serine/threonine protein kinase/ABC-type branched-subunit amino acid transport system substrate-binding protein